MTRQPVLIATICLVLAGIGDVGAEPLTKNQQKCAGRMNKDLAKVDAAVAKQVTGCLKNHARGKPLSKTDPSVVTLEGCIVADEKEKISKATQKTFDDFDKACVGTDRGGVSNYPPFAATNASMVNDAGTTKALNLSHDIFGADLDSGVLLTAEMSRHAAMCQQKVWKAAAKCQSTRLKEFASCAKAAFKSGSVGSGEELENQCQGSAGVPQSDDKGKIAKACLGAEGGIGKTVSKCDEDLDLDSLLPGCAGEAHADCVAEKVATRVCQLINQAGGLARDCGDATEIQYVAGLRAGGLSSASGMSFLLNPGNLDTVSSNSGAVGGIDPFGPSAAWSESQEPSGPWQTNWTVAYTGQIADADGVMSFREDFFDEVWLEVCGQVVLDDTTWLDSTTGTVDCGGGDWHSFELRLHNADLDGGMRNNIGFEWDPAGGSAWQLPMNSDASTADVFRTEEGVAFGGDCSADSCVSDLSCVANTCQLELGLEDDCTAANTVCGSGLTCSEDTCKTELSAGGNCYPADTVCTSGLACYLGSCQMELGLGEDCSASNTYCQSGLVCSGGTTCQTPAGNERINVYPTVPGLAPSDQYSFRVRAVGETEWLEPFPFITRSIFQSAAGHDFSSIAGWSKTYINFEMSGSTQVEIEISKVSGNPIESVAPHPWDAATSWSVVGGKGYVIIDEPGLFAVDIDSQMDRYHTGWGYENHPHQQSPVHAVAIFANPVLADKPDLNAPTVHVVEPGTMPPDLESAGYESITTVAFAAGVHDIGQGYRLRTNRSYYIPGDAMIYGQMNNGDGSVWNDGHNIHIYGHGTISGEKIPHPYTGPDPAVYDIPSPYPDKESMSAELWYTFYMISIKGAHGSVVEGITIADAPFHQGSIWPGYGENEAYLKWSKLLGWRLNSDGISAPNLRIENCYYVTQDDAIYLYDGIQVRNTVFSNEANGTTFIFAPLGTWAGFNNPAVVEDVVVIYNRMAWLSFPGAVFAQRVGCTGITCSSQSDGEAIFRNIRIEDRTPTTPHFIMALAEGASHWSGLVGNRGPYGISGLIFENLEAVAPSFLKQHYNIPPSNFSDNNVVWGEYSDVLWGDEVGGALFSNLTFENFTEEGEAVTSLDHFVTNAAVANMTFTPAAQAATCPLGARIEVEEPASSNQWVPAVIEGGPNADGNCLTGYDDCWTDESLGWTCYGNEYDKWRTPGTYRSRPVIPSDPSYVPGLRAGAFDFPEPTAPPWSNDMSFDPNPGNLDTNTTESRATGGVDPIGPSLNWTRRAPPWKPHWTLAYTGQIYDADGLMSFRESIDGIFWLKVDGQVLIEDGTWNNITTATVDLGSGGWFDFELRIHNEYGNAGIIDNLIGFEWDRDGGTKWRRPKNFDATTADLFRTCATDNNGDGICE